MAGNKLRDLRILEVQKLDSPEEMASEIPVTEKALETVVKGRREAQGIIRREDNRFLLVVGPCSIHDTQQALVYASRLAELRSKYSDKLCIFMRVYFEKPRTALGWRGLIVDPGLDGTYDIQRGMKAARKLLEGKEALSAEEALSALQITAIVLSGVALAAVIAGAILIILNKKKV